MELLLHIGTEKTGSTAIQAWLDANDRGLAQSGIHVARCLGRPDHRWLAIQARTPGRPVEDLLSPGLQAARDPAALGAHLAAALADEVAAAEAADCHLFVISSEHLHSRLPTATEVNRVAALLAPLFDGVEVLCYLRPQAELHQSRLSVGVRALAHGPWALEAFATDPAYYDYFALWQRWSAAFGEVTLVPFRRVGDVVQDFAARLGVSATGPGPGARLNGRLDWRAGLLSHVLAGTPAAARARPLLAALPWDDLPVDEPLQLSRDLVVRINDAFRTSNRALMAACPHLRPADLTADPHRFPETGSVMQSFAPWPAAEVLGELILRLNAELQLERARGQVLLAERALAGQGAEDPAAALARARALVALVVQADLPALRADLAQIGDSLAWLSARLD
ncbi:MAG: hypothetical protein IE927_03230 [Rhodobacterales bacterium]|nr:hypothetical protein [Rhodobacterales bacterium]